MRRVHQQAGDTLLEDVVDRLPVDARALHRGMGHSVGIEPIAQRQQIGGRGAKGLPGPACLARPVRAIVALWTSSPHTCSNTCSIPVVRQK